MKHIDRPHSLIIFDWHSWTGLVLFLSKRTDFPSSNKSTGAPGKSKTLLCSGAKASEVSVARLTQIHCWWEQNNYRWDLFIAKELAESPQTLWRHITVAKLQSPSHAVMRTVKMPQINNSRLQLPSTLDSINLSSGLFSPACWQNQTLQRSADNRIMSIMNDIWILMSCMLCGAKSLNEIVFRSSVCFELSMPARNNKK